MNKSDKPAVKVEPPHSMALRAKQRSMPNTPGVHVHKPDAAGDAPTAESSGDEPAGESDISPRLREIHAAISKVPLNDESAWTKARGPRVSALEAVLGYQITEAERDAAWALNQEK